jgi:hypothetical protein
LDRGDALPICPQNRIVNCRVCRWERHAEISIVRCDRRAFGSEPGSSFKSCHHDCLIVEPQEFASLRLFPFIVQAITEIANTRRQTTGWLDALDGR